MTSSPLNTINGFDISSTHIYHAKSILDEKEIVNVGIQTLDIEENGFWNGVRSGFSQLVQKGKLGGENVIVCLPGEYAIIKKIKIESDESAVEETIIWELSQQIIGSIDEYVYDYQRVVTQNSDGLDEYLVVGYRTVAINRISQLIRANKVQPLVIDLDIFALINVFEMNYDDILSSPSIIVYSDFNKTKVILTQNGTFIDIDFIDHPSKTVDTQTFITKLTTRIRQLCSYNENFSDTAEPKVYVTGMYYSETEVLSGVADAVKNVEILDPFRKIRCNAGMSEEEIRKYGPQLAVAVGLACREID